MMRYAKARMFKKKGLSCNLGVLTLCGPYLCVGCITRCLRADRLL